MDLFESMMALEESLATARKKYLDTKQMDQATFDSLTDADPTPTKKYLEWMCKQAVEGEATPDEIIPVIAEFDDFVNRNQIEHKDINSYNTFQELQAKVDATKEKGDSKSQQKKAIKKDKNVVYEDENITVLVPQNHEQSRLYGANTKWCTAERTSTNWDSYWAQGVKMYYIMDKKNNTKYAVAVYPSGEKKVFAANDSSMTMESLMDKIGIQV